MAFWSMQLQDAYFFSVSIIKSDLLTGQNFFTWQPDHHWDCLITNPPFSLKYRWLERCYQLGRPFALLMQVDVFGAKSAQRLFEKYGIQVILLDRRLSFKMPNMGWEGGGSHFSTAWFTWGMGLRNTLNYFHMPAPECPYCCITLRAEVREDGKYCTACGGKVGRAGKKKPPKS